MTLSYTAVRIYNSCLGIERYDDARSTMEQSSRITISTLRARKREKQKFSMLTCYDHATARLMHEAGIETILVGDTYGEVCLGHSTTLPVKLDHLLTITEAVRRGAPDCYLVGDMPYLTYQVCPEGGDPQRGSVHGRRRV